MTEWKTNNFYITAHTLFTRPHTHNLPDGHAHTLPDGPNYFLYLVRVDKTCQVGLNHLWPGETVRGGGVNKVKQRVHLLVIVLHGGLLLPRPVQSIQFVKGSFRPDTESPHMTTRRQQQEIHTIYLQQLNTWGREIDTVSTHIGTQTVSTHTHD